MREQKYQEVLFFCTYFYWLRLIWMYVCLRKITRKSKEVWELYLSFKCFWSLSFHLKWKWSRYSFVIDFIINMALIFSLLGIYRDIFSLQTFYKLVEVVVYVLCSFVHTIVLSTKLGGKTMFKMSLKTN